MICFVSSVFNSLDASHGTRITVAKSISKRPWQGRSPAVSSRQAALSSASGQTQRQAAAQIGVLRKVYDRWERDETEPPVGFWKRLVAFLGYYPMPQNGGEPANLVLMARRVQGLSQYALGRKLGAIAKTVRLWEHGLREPDPVRLERLHALAGGIAPSI